MTLAPMEVLAPGSAHARPSARPPIDTSGNFSAHMSGGGGGGRVQTKPKSKALTKKLPRIRLLVSVLGLRKFKIPGRISVIGFTILDIIG